MANTIQKIQLIKNRDKITVQEAADIMGVSPQFLRYALLQGKFPFGVGVQMKQNEFYINPLRFALYMEGADLLKKGDNHELASL